MTAASVISWIENTEVYGTARKQVPLITSVTDSAKWLADGFDSNLKLVTDVANIQTIQEAVVSTVSNNTARVRDYTTAKVAATRENIQSSVARIQQSIDATPEVKSKATAVLSFVRSLASQLKTFSDSVPEVLATYQKDYPVLQTNAIFSTILLLICTIFAAISRALAPAAAQESPDAEKRLRKKK